MKNSAEQSIPAKKSLLKSKHTGYGPVSAVVVMLLVFFLSQFIAVGILVWFAPLFGFDSRSVLDEVDSDTLLQFTFIAITEALTIYGIWAFLKSRAVSWKTIGLSRRPKLRDVGSALLVFVVYFATLAFLTAVISYVLPSVNLEQKQQLGFDQAKVTGDLILVFISLVILPPIAEEIMVRGFLYTGLRAKFTKISSAIITSAIFGLAHLQLGSGAAPLWNAAIDTMLLSFFLIYLREKTGALWAGMLVHGLKNCIAFLILFVFT